MSLPYLLLLFSIASELNPVFYDKQLEHNLNLTHQGKGHKAN